MAYNNGFPVSYQPMYYQPQYTTPNQYYAQQQAQNQATNNSSVIWVQGEAGAKSYLVAPNTTVQLWDSENQVIYLKSADASGMPSIKTLDYTVRELRSGSNAFSEQGGKDIPYATKADVDALRGEIDAIKAEIMRTEETVNG